MPTGDAPHKRIADDPGREQRLAMTRLAGRRRLALLGLDPGGRSRRAVLHI
jgi:hypothetical protein